MKSIRKVKKLFWSAVACLFIMSASFLFMPKSAESAQQNKIYIVLNGLMFWLPAITGYILIFIACKERKRFISNHNDANMKKYISGSSFYYPFITFFSNVPAAAADVVMLAMIVLLAISQFTKLKNTYLIYVILFALNFSLHMHFLFNSKIYLFTKIKKQKRRKTYD